MAKYTTVITVKITSDESGSGDFADYTAKYSNQSYDSMQTLQGTLVMALKGLGDAKLGKK